MKIKAAIAMPSAKFDDTFNEDDLLQIPVLTNKSFIPKGTRLIAQRDTALEKLNQKIADARATKAKRAAATAKASAAAKRSRVE